MGILIAAAKISGLTSPDIALHQPLLEVAFDIEDAHAALAQWAETVLDDAQRAEVGGLEPAELVQRLTDKQFPGLAAHIEVFENDPVPNTEGLYGFGIFAEDCSIEIFASGTMDQDNWESIDADAMEFSERFLEGDGAFYLEGLSFDHEGKRVKQDDQSMALEI